MTAIVVGAVVLLAAGVLAVLHLRGDPDVLHANADTARPSVPSSLGPMYADNPEPYKGPALTGAVKTAAGALVQGARVLVSTGRNPVVMVLDGNGAGDASGGTAETGPDGRFTVQPNARPRAIFVRGREGLAFATVPGSASKGSEPVQLAPLVVQPWGRVEVAVGTGVVDPEARFDCSSEVRFAEAGVFFSIGATAKPGARLVLAQVPPGQFWLGISQGQGPRTSHRYSFRVEGGKSVSTLVGIPGRSVAGRLDKPVVGFTRRRVSLESASSEVGETFDSQIEPDGTFRIDGVAPGKYRLTARLWMSTGNGGLEQAGQTQQAVAVSAAVSAADRPFDVGELRIDIPERFAVGRRAPELAGTAADGSRVSNSSFLGRHVLISLTSGPGSSSWKDVLALRALYDRYGGNPTLAVVTEYAGTAVEQVRQAAFQAGVSWPVLDCGSSFDSLPAPFAGAKHSIFVIDPSGVILASAVDPFQAWVVLGEVLRSSAVVQPRGTRIQVDRLMPQQATTAATFPHVAAPASDDAAAGATTTVVDGTMPEGSDCRACLNDGKMPKEDDSPGENFRFAIGTLEGRVRFDLGSVLPVSEIHSYSWHPNTRAPQLYRVYGSDGAGAGFDPAPKFGTDPAERGWTLIADVDTRPATGPPGGKYAVSISRDSGGLGNCRYLLFVMFPTEADDGSGNTFYSEIDVIRK